jgi:hypothetical protein
MTNVDAALHRRAVKAAPGAPGGSNVVGVRAPPPPSIQACHQRLSLHLMSILRSHTLSSSPIPAANPNRKQNFPSATLVSSRQDQTTGRTNTSSTGASSRTTSASTCASGSRGRSTKLSSVSSSVSSRSRQPSLEVPSALDRLVGNGEDTPSPSTELQPEASCSDDQHAAEGEVLREEAEVDLYMVQLHCTTRASSDTFKAAERGMFTLDLRHAKYSG